MGFLRLVGDEFRSERLLPSLTAGVLIGISEVIFALSVGSLIFSGELAPYLSYGIGITLVTTTILLVVTSLGSSIPGVTGSLQDSPSVLLAIIAGGLAGGFSATALEAGLPTILVAMAASTLLTGAVFLVFGFFNLGRLVRFMPYPVMGGFLAGTGWLLVKGSFGVMTGLPLTLANIPALLHPEQLLLWGTGMAFALILFFSLRYIKRFWLMPAVLLGVLLLFYLPFRIGSQDNLHNKGYF